MTRKKHKLFLTQAMLFLLFLWIGSALSIPLLASKIPRFSDCSLVTRLGPETNCRRSLDDILGHPDSPLGNSQDDHRTRPEIPTHTTNGQVPSPHPSPHTTPGFPIVSLLSVAAATTGATNSHSLATAPPPGRYSIIGSLPPVPSPTRSNVIMTTFSTSGAHAYPTSSSPSATASASKDSTAVRQWKIIGVAVIAFSTVAAILLLAVFFDQWWRFVKDLIVGRRNGGKGLKEELVPDWDKASWEVKFGDSQHRYPSFSSFPGAKKGREGVEGRLENGGQRNEEREKVGWVRPDGRTVSPLGLIQDQTEQETTSNDPDTLAERKPTGEMQISAMGSYNVNRRSQQHARSHTLTRASASNFAYTSPCPPVPALTRSTSATVSRSRSQRSHREVGPCHDMPVPPSPGTKSVSGESVYGGIA